MSHPFGYTVTMNRKTPTAKTLSSSTTRSATSLYSTSSIIPSAPVLDHRANEKKKSEGSGLLGLCHEIAGLLLRRYAENTAAPAVRREVKGKLMQMMACDAKRADHLLDLALELIHVKAKGRYKRNALELSLLIARAGDQVRNVEDN